MQHGTIPTPRLLDGLIRMAIVSVFAFILVLLAVGALLRVWRLVPDTAPETLNIVAIYVCMPAAILLNVPRLSFERELIGLIAIPWICLAVSIALVLALARLLRWDRPSTACLLMEVPMGNTAFIGYALIPALAGPSAMRYAVVYDQFGTFLILASFGLFVLALYGGGARPTVAAIAGRVLRFPPFLALLLGLTVMPAELPVAFARPLETLSGALLPIVVIALGMQLRLKLPRRYLAPLGIGLVAKLIALPLLAVALCAAFGLTGDLRAVAVFQTAMPTMMTTGALLSMAGLAPELAAAMVGYGTVLSIVTLPLWHWVL
jgi:predicted permease